MEPRLVPVNALIAMFGSGDGAYPSPFSALGYKLEGVEIPVGVLEGKRVVVDAVAFRADRNILLAGEAKSGPNVEVDQAKKYSQLDPDAVVQASSVTIEKPGARIVQPVYACLEENLERVLLGLGEAGLACPVLSISKTHVEHHGAEFIDPDLNLAFAAPLAVPGLPPRVVVVDDQSSDEAFDDQVLPALVAELSHKRVEISVKSLTEKAVAHLPIYGQAARSRLVKSVDAAARRVADRDPQTFQYYPHTGTREAHVRFVRSPEEAARQGRTQSYQAIARAGGRTSRRQRMKDLNQGEFDFDELIEELEQSSETVDPVEGTVDGTVDEREGEVGA